MVSTRCQGAEPVFGPGFLLVGIMQTPGNLGNDLILKSIAAHALKNAIRTHYVEVYVVLPPSITQYLNKKRLSNIVESLSFSHFKR